MKAILSTETVNAYIDIHNKMQIPYTITLTNYTTRIVSNYCDIHFMKKEQSNRTFAAYAKVLKDCKKTPLPVLDEKYLNYFSHNFKGTDIYSDIIYNVDLKSAYASALLVNKMITPDTYKYLNSLPKLDRLAAVGMMAGKKNIFEVGRDGKIISEKKVVSQNAYYFFFCVKCIADIMQQAAQIVGNAFLFSWVDGIYFLQGEEGSKTAGKIVQEFFSDNGYKSTFDILTNFEIQNKKSFFKASYKKDGKSKFINVPIQDSTGIKKIVNYLLTKNY